ncbi:MAG TPA: AbrB family transcriptional regulator, partial [Thermoanaerobaculia bacterium]|nr:AbrB family transcriptional regulator [Thermoanaerobaculia bacterium]
SLGLRSGEKVQVFRYGDRIEFVPVRRLKRMRGFLKGIDTAVPRDKDRV